MSTSPEIETISEWCEAMGAYLVTCRVNGKLHNARFSEEPEDAARAMRYEAASELV